MSVHFSPAKVSSLLLCFLVSPFTAFADSPVWLIQSAQHKLYLGATLHVLRAEDYPLPKSFEQGYKASSKVCFETDIAATRSAEFQHSMAKAMRLPQGVTLNQLLSTKVNKKLKDYLQEIGIPLQSVQKMSPVAVSLTLTIAQLQRIGVAEQGVDEFFFRRAQQDGKAQCALESPQRQLQYLIKIAEENESQLIEQTLDELRQLKNDFILIAGWWKNGELDALEEKLIATMKKDYPRVYQQLLVERNHNWMPQIESMLKTPETELVLVGAAHLIGPDGLLKLLRQKGYQVSAVQR